MAIMGRIQGIETLGGADGPGLRTVVFMQGCHLRCAYCHNPETWDLSAGQATSASELVQKLIRMKPYFGSEGGVTLSGGEPLLQPLFALEVFRQLKAAGVSTALDTAGVAVTEDVLAVLAQSDIVLLDIKMPDEKRYKEWIGGSLATALHFLKAASTAGCRIWIRHVVVPGINDSEADLALLNALIRASGVQIEKLELLDYHRLGLEKYENLGIPYRLDSV